jgi:hypothetical protein
MDSQRGRPLKKSLAEFLIHGVKYAFPPDHGGLTRGVPTGYAAPPLKDMISQPNEPPPVWPDPDGDTRGYEFSPLYKSVPRAASKDKILYELLAIVDAIRDGRAREREIAIKELKTRLGSPCSILLMICTLHLLQSAPGLPVAEISASPVFLFHLSCKKIIISSLSVGRDRCSVVATCNAGTDTALCSNTAGFARPLKITA